MSKGFLVVLKFPDDALRSKNPRYRGIDRLPPYPSNVVEEEEPLDDYVFQKKYNSEEGLIPSLSLARELVNRFRKSPRQFEIIYVRTIVDTSLPQSFQLAQSSLVLMWRMKPLFTR
jgi:hypothetical protein